ncbi:MAG: hydroxysqualene dehydroxylase HpnE [Azovibrio sp.]
MKLAVIGGGWAGISAAVELAELNNHGATITLFEAGRMLGGRARRMGNTTPHLDNGQHILLGAYREILALMVKLGVPPEQELQRLPLRVEDNRGFCLALPRLPAPINLAWGLLTARGGSLSEKIRTALWMQGLKRRKFQLEKDISVAQWLDEAGQTGVLRHHLWEPLCLAALNTPVNRASAQLFANVLKDSLGSPLAGATDLLIPKTTLSALIPDPATAWLTARGAQIRTSYRVKTLTQTPAGWDVDDEHFDKIILAVAPQHVQSLLPEQAVPSDFEPIGTVYLHYPPEVKQPFPLMALYGGTGQWVVDRGNGLLAASLSGGGNWEEMDDLTLAQTLHQELGQTGPLPDYQVIREKKATFTCTLGQTRPGTLTSKPGLFLAGDYTYGAYPATLEGAVISGQLAARAAIAD